MSGYRDRSSGFDPSAGGGAYGAPLRPYNWVQWVGVALIVVGVALFLAVSASQLGWISPKLKDSFPAATGLLFIGSLFVNSRRAEVTAEDMERRRRRGFVALAVACVAFAIALVVIIYSKGV